MLFKNILELENESSYFTTNVFSVAGYIELISSADIIVMYDDIQFSKGSFTNRVQIKGSNGKFWLTAPIKKEKNQKLL